MTNPRTVDTEYLRQFVEVGGAREVMLSDDGRVGYAYLRSPLGATHAWLYNVDSPGRTKRAKRTEQPPNPVGYCRRDVAIERLSDGLAATVVFGDTVDVFFGDTLVARFDSMEAPGRSLLAAKDGPLARVLR